MALVEKAGRKTYVPIRYLLANGLVKLEDVHQVYLSQGSKKAAEFFNVSIGTLYAVLKKNGFGDTSRTVISKLDENIKQQVVNDLGQGTARFVSKKYGLSYVAVCKLAKEHGVHLHRAIPWSPAEASVMITELTENSLECVAKKHGYSSKKLMKLARIAGL